MKKKSTTWQGFVSLGLGVVFVAVVSSCVNPQVYQAVSSQTTIIQSSCTQVPELSVTIPEGVKAGSSVVVAATIQLGVRHMESQSDSVNLHISMTKDSCDDHPGYYIWTLPAPLPTWSKYYTTTTFRRVFHFDTDVEGPVTFYVNGYMQEGGDNQFDRYYRRVVTAVVHPSP